MEITKAFSLRINELIDETGLSLENLSRAAGVSVFTLFHLRKRFYIVSSQRAEQSQASFHQGAFKACGLFQVLAVFYAGTGGMQFSAVAQNRAARIFRQTQGIDRSQRTQIFSYEKIGAEKGLSLHVQLAQRQVYTKRLQSRETGKTSRLLGGLSFGQGII